MQDGVTNDLEESDSNGNVGLAFNQGFFFRSDVAENEDTAEIMSYLVHSHKILVQAYLVDDFDGENDLGVEIIPGPEKGVAFIRIDRNMWDFIEDVAGCEHEEFLFKGMVLGELLVGTAHRMIVDQTGHLPPFI
jgi:hypothetical protein